MSEMQEGWLHIGKGLIREGVQYVVFTADSARATEGISVGDFIVVNATDPVVEGDRIAYATAPNRPELGHLLKNADGLWCLRPFKGAKRPPVFTDDYAPLVIGKIDRVLRVPVAEKEHQ